MGVLQVSEFSLARVVVVVVVVVVMGLREAGAFSVRWGVGIVDGFECVGGKGRGWREELVGCVGGGGGFGFGGCLSVMPGIWFKSCVQSFHGWVVEIYGVCLCSSWCLHMVRSVHSVQGALLF